MLLKQFPHFIAKCFELFLLFGAEGPLRLPVGVHPGRQPQDVFARQSHVAVRGIAASVLQQFALSGGIIARDRSIAFEDERRQIAAGIPDQRFPGLARTEINLRRLLRSRPPHGGTSTHRCSSTGWTSVSKRKGQVPSTSN